MCGRGREEGGGRREEVDITFHPITQTQASTLVDPLGDAVLSGHGRQVMPTALVL